MDKLINNVIFERLYFNLHTTLSIVCVCVGKLRYAMVIFDPFEWIYHHA